VPLAHRRRSLPAGSPHVVLLALLASPLDATTRVLEAQQDTTEVAAERGARDAEERREDVSELVSDRPDVTESTSIVPVAWVQTETGLTLEFLADDSQTFTAPATLLRFGISDRVEARLAWQGYQDVSVQLDRSPGNGTADDPDVSGAADGEASLKVLLIEQEGARPDVAVLTAASLPIGEEAFSSGRMDPELKALFSKDFTEQTGLAGNLGIAWPTAEEAGREVRVRTLAWSLSLGVDLVERLSGFLEYFAEEPEDQSSSHSLDAGLTYDLSPHVQLDASGGLGLDDDAADWFFGSGLAFRFGL
jgi:hypothetical protein